uniref:Reverse transcriptase Ty1/copia-type domain-containing protein n=1 Tax=Amphimedon queenslandica TaxID=400682 RepID=A0A1X7T3K7_AMPQE
MIEWCKAWLVAQGYSQRQGQDYKETFSPVVRFESICTIVALAVQNGQKIHQMDVEHLWFKAVSTLLELCTGCSIEREPFTLAIHVDDILLASKTDERLDDVNRQLASKFKIKDLGELCYFLGVKVVQNTEKQTIWLGQPTYTKQLLEQFNMSDAKATKTPVNPVSSVARYTAKPTSEHWKAVKHIFRYLIGTVNFGLLCSRTSSICVGYSDSDWGGDLDDRKSTSGYIFQIGGGAVSWQSRKESCVALSTSEAEYIALTSAAQEAIWLRHLLSEIEQEQEKKIVIYEDNQLTICLSKNPQFHDRSKHIAIKYHFIRDQVKDGTVELNYCKTEEMLTDVFTKGLSGERFHMLTNKIGVRKMDDSSSVQ